MEVKNKERLLWFCIGCLSATGLLAIALAYTGQVKFSYWLYSYQTLVAAVFAIPSAILTVHLTIKSAREQISHSSQVSRDQILNALKIEDDKRAERLLMGRARLSFSLSVLHHCCKVTIGDLARRMEVDQSQDANSSTSSVFSDESLSRFKLGEVLEAVSLVAAVCTPTVARELTRLLILLQLCVSRIREAELKDDFRRVDVISHHETTGLMIDVCALNAKLARVYPFARFMSDEIVIGSISQDEFSNSAFILKAPLDDQEFARLINRFEKLDLS